MKLVEGMIIRYATGLTYKLVPAAGRLWLQGHNHPGPSSHGDPSGRPAGCYSDREEAIIERLRAGESSIVGGHEVAWAPEVLDAYEM